MAATAHAGMPTLNRRYSEIESAKAIKSWPGDVENIAPCVATSVIIALPSAEGVPIAAEAAYWRTPLRGVPARGREMAGFVESSGGCAI